jgi:predicted enzyme related to lactoylglutathione lyase
MALVATKEIAMTTATLAESTKISIQATAQPATTRRQAAHTAVWFEIPVRDLAAATRFYQQTFGIEFQITELFPGLAVFPRRESTSTTGALVEIHEATSTQPRSLCGNPSVDGSIVYLSCDGQLDAVIHRALEAGATLLEEVAQLPANLGYTAQLRDPEGNRIGLHAAF